MKVPGALTLLFALITTCVRLNLGGKLMSIHFMLRHSNVQKNQVRGSSTDAGYYYEVIRIPNRPLVPLVVNHIAVVYVTPRNTLTSACSIRMDIVWAGQI